MATIFFCFIRFQTWCLFIFLFTTLHAQKDNIWISHDSIGIDLRYDPPKIFTVPTLPCWYPDSIFYRDKLDNTSSVRMDDTTYFYLQSYYIGYNRLITFDCDTLKKPFMTTYLAKGAHLRDKNHNIVPNGDSLALSYRDNFISQMIPLNDNMILIFTHAFYDGRFIPGNDPRCLFRPMTPRLYYHKLERKSNIWTVTEKNKIMADVDIAAKITAVRHSNGKDWWLLTHERNASDCFLKFLVLGSGSVVRYPNQCIGRVHAPDYYKTYDPDLQEDSQMSFSKDGSKLVVGAKCKGLYYFGTQRQYKSIDTIPILDVFDFDRCSGTLYNYKNYGIKIPKPVWKQRGGVCGVQFSPNKKYLYYTTFNGKLGVCNRIYCFNMQNDSLSYLDTDTLDSIDESVFPTSFGLGPKDEFYIKSNYATPGRKYIAKILYPDRGLANCGFVRKGLFLEGKTMWFDFSLNNPNYELDGIAVQQHRHDTTHCYWRPLQLGISRPLDDLYYYEWHSLETSLKLQGDIQSAQYTHEFQKEKEGSYRFVRYRYRTAESCTTAIDTFVVKVSKAIPPCYTGVEPTGSVTPQLKIYPNPVQDILRISSNRNILRIHFYDLTGKRIVTREPLDPSLEYDFDVSGMATGGYLCEIETDLGKLRQRVVVERY